MSYLLLTGATGLVGRYLLKNLLLAQRPVAVLTRGRRTESASLRVESIVARWEEQTGRPLMRPVVLPGSLVEPDLGLRPAGRDWLKRNCRTAIHSAASLTFAADEKSGEPSRTNIDGTRNLLRLCGEAGIEEFHFVSTSYVCGRRDDVVTETDANPNADFRNAYEKTKAAAEQMVRSNFGHQATIYRPSIIVGDSRTAETSTFRGLYTPLQIAYLLAESHGLNGVTAFFTELGIDQSFGKNVVPVDWVADVISHILNQPSLHGGVFHVTNPRPVLVADIRESILDVVSEALRRRGRGEMSPGLAVSPGDSDLRRAMAVYETYLGNDPRFDSTNTQRAAPQLACPSIEPTLLKKLNQFAIENRFSSLRTTVTSLETDFVELLGQLPGRRPGVNGEHSLQLDLTGPGGGCWTVGLRNGQPVSAENGRCGTADAVLYAPASVLEAVVTGHLTLTEALRNRMSLEFRSSARLASELTEGALKWMQQATESAAPLRYVG
jgi:nucleoside-diphosphate-sugar epimerase